MTDKLVTLKSHTYCIDFYSDFFRVPEMIFTYYLSCRGKYCGENPKLSYGEEVNFANQNKARHLRLGIVASARAFVVDLKVPDSIPVWQTTFTRRCSSITLAVDVRINIIPFCGDVFITNK